MVCASKGHAGGCLRSLEGASPRRLVGNNGTHLSADTRGADVRKPRSPPSFNGDIALLADSALGDVAWERGSKPSFDQVAGGGPVLPSAGAEVLGVTTALHKPATLSGSFIKACRG
jgi:hypothetical protein